MASEISATRMAIDTAQIEVFTTAARILSCMIFVCSGENFSVYTVLVGPGTGVVTICTRSVTTGTRTTFTCSLVMIIVRGGGGVKGVAVGRTPLMVVHTGVGVGVCGVVGRLGLAIGVGRAKLDAPSAPVELTSSRAPVSPADAMTHFHTLTALHYTTEAVPVSKSHSLSSCFRVILSLVFPLL